MKARIPSKAAPQRQRRKFLLLLFLFFFTIVPLFEGMCADLPTAISLRGKSRFTLRPQSPIRKNSFFTKSQDTSPLPRRTISLSKKAFGKTQKPRRIPKEFKNPRRLNRRQDDGSPALRFAQGEGPGSSGTIRKQTRFRQRAFIKMPSRGCHKVRSKSPTRASLTQCLRSAQTEIEELSKAINKASSEKKRIDKFIQRTVVSNSQGRSLQGQSNQLQRFVNTGRGRQTTAKNAIKQLRKQLREITFRPRN